MTINIKGVTSCLGYGQETSLSSAKALPSQPVRDKLGCKEQATVAYIVAEAQALRWRDDGIAPTATVGMPLAVGVPFPYDGDITGIRFIEQTSGGILNVTYYA